MFCLVCGRINPCKHHSGKPEKIKRIRQMRFSGDSKFRQQEGQFQGKVGR